MSGRHIHPDRSATAAVRRAALHHAASAERALGRSRLSDWQVHQARKQIKKSRAALRLLRAAMPQPTYRREDAALRSAAHALNAARDARVLLRTLESLCRRRAAFGRDTAAAALSKLLRRRQAQALHQLRQQPALLSAARATLRQLQLRAPRWRLGQLGWQLLRRGFKRIYRGGRRGAHAAKRRSDAFTMHQWRKQVQYLSHALQILKPLQSRLPSKATAVARRLADYLGEAHDLALLRSTASAFGQSHEPLGEEIQAAIERRRAVLQLKAIAAGKRLYARKPRAMAARACGRPRTAV